MQSPPKRSAKIPRTHSLTTILSLYSLSLILGLIVLLGASVFLVDSHRLHGNLKNQVALQAEQIMDQSLNDPEALTMPNTSTNSSGPTVTIPNSSYSSSGTNQLGLSYLQVLNPSESLVKVTSNGRTFVSSQAADHLVWSSQSSNVTIGGESYLVVSLEEGGVAVTVGSETAPIASQLRALALAIVLTSIPILILVLIFSRWLGGIITRPLRLLADSVKTLGAHGGRLPVDGTQEEATLISTSFNGALERLDQSFGRQKKLVQDVSHELRTPLTIMRGHLELAAESGDAERLRKASLRALDEIDSMSTLVTTLLSDVGGAREELSLDLVVREQAAKASQLGPRNWTFDLERVTLVGERLGMEQVLSNLYQNAVAYSPSGTTVATSLRVEDGRVVLEVRDEGEGIPAPMLDQIFDRFRKVDDSRESKGFGLGLSICREIVERHGGTISAANGEVGATFTVELPL